MPFLVSSSENTLFHRPYMPNFLPDQAANSFPIIAPIHQSLPPYGKLSAGRASVQELNHNFNKFDE